MQFNDTCAGGVVDACEHVSDETLVKEFQAGDREAFAVLYRRYAGQVAGYVRKRRGRASDAECEDLVQEIFTEALARLADADMDRPDEFGRWLFGVVAPRVLYLDGKAYWLGRQVRFRSEDKLRMELRDNPTQAAALTAPGTALSEALRARVAELRPHYRQVLELRYIEGQSIDQTAEIMGRTPGSVRHLTAAAVDELRNPDKVKHDRYTETCDELRSGEPSEALRARVAELRPHYRQVLELRYIEGQSIDQTAEIMGRTPGSVTWITSAALDELRNPKQVKHDRADKVARILSAARHVLAERGEDGFTMRAVCEEAGVSGGLAAHYFGSRAGLLTAARNGDQPAEGHRPVIGRRAGGPRSAAIRCRSTDGGAALAGAMGGAR